MPCYNKSSYKWNDLWSIGNILLFFMPKKDIFDINLKEEKYIYEYILLYGKPNVNAKFQLIYNVSKYISKYDNAFIENNIKREIDEKEKYYAINVIKGLLQLNFRKRLSAEDSLNHSFLNGISTIEKKSNQFI